MHQNEIVGVETADHPTGGEIVAHARSYFKGANEWAVLAQSVN
jgi:hypothetical protein